MSARRHGQAMTEFVLGLLVFITILLFGIHFAEVGFLSQKLHEAEAAAIWDSTAYRSWQFGAWSDSGRTAAPGAALNGLARYSDWDGRTAINNVSPTLALSRADPMTLECERVGGVSYPLAALAPGFGEAGGVACHAEGDVTAFRIPTRFAEGATGFFQAANNTRASSPMHMCGSGRAVGANCPGRLGLLLGDYALTDRNDALECPLATSSPSGCSNGAFYSVTLANFNQSMRMTAGWAEGWTGRPERWTRNIVDGLPSGRITGFYMSFRGNESRFEEPVRNGGTWQTNPMDSWMPRTPYRSAHTFRQGCEASSGYCFLGRYPCN